MNRKLAYRPTVRLDIILLLAVLMLVPAKLVAQQEEGSLRIVFAGDIMGHVPLHNAALQGDGTYDYEPCFRHVKDYISNADIAVANLEVTLAGKPYTGYPHFSAPDALAAAARDAGFDILTTANNHCMDKGRLGLERTLRQLDSLGIEHLGTYTDREQWRTEHPLIVEQGGITVALLCYTYGTNGISVTRPNIVNMIDTAVMLRDLRVAREWGAEFVIAIMHWGIEYQRKGNAEQAAVARWLLDHGCNAVIGGHPHVVQNIVPDINPNNDRQNELVVYSMGNLLSNQRDLGTDGGIMVELELTKREGIVTLEKYSYLPYWVHRTWVDGHRQYLILPAEKALAEPEKYQLGSSDINALKRFYEDVLKRVEGR